MRRTAPTKESTEPTAFTYIMYMSSELTQRKKANRRHARMEMLQRKKYSKIDPWSTRTAIGLVPKRPGSNRGTHTCKRERAKGIRTENAQYKKDPSILKISR